MEPLKVFYNPACSKCRRVHEILDDRAVPYELIEYLKTPPDRETLEGLLWLPGIVATELVRRDKRFAELGLDETSCETPEQVVELLLAHPELLERPVVVAGDRAVIARPPERVLELLD